jgi:hypothetical protein
MRQCSEAPGLETWLRETLDRYHLVATAPLVAAALATMLHEIPLLLNPDEADCVWSGHLGEIACWQTHDDAGRVTGRLATAPKVDLLVPRSIVMRYPRSYHQSAIGAGPDFLAEHPNSYDRRALLEGPHFSGYIIGDDLVGCLNISRGERLFYLVAQFPGASIVDYEGYWEGEALLARLQIVASNTDA